MGLRGNIVILWSGFVLLVCVLAVCALVVQTPREK